MARNHNQKIDFPIVSKFVLITKGNLGFQNNYNALEQNKSFVATDFSSQPGYSNLFSVFNYYRIAKIEITYEIYPTQVSGYPGQLGIFGGDTSIFFSSSLVYIRTPSFIYWKDTTGQSPDVTTYTEDDAGWNKLLNREVYNQKRTSRLTVSYKPRPLITTTSGNFPMDSNPWISTQKTSIPFYGMNIYLNSGDNSFITTDIVQTYRKTYTAYFEFKGPNM